METWKDSLFWKQTDASAPIVYLEVAGDSMAPYYLDGDIIACRRPASNDAVINNKTPCIFRCNGDYTFKIFHKKKGIVIGRPLNPSYEPVIFGKDDEFTIDFVVLGKVDPGWCSRF